MAVVTSRSIGYSDAISVSGYGGWSDFMNEYAISFTTSIENLQGRSDSASAEVYLSAGRYSIKAAADNANAGSSMTFNGVNCSVGGLGGSGNATTVDVESSGNVTIAITLINGTTDAELLIFGDNPMGFAFTVDRVDVEGCTDPNADNYNPIANINSGCIYKGCTDPQANNYDSGANQDDGSCTYDPPTVSISLSQSWIVNTGTQSSTLSWSTGGGPIDSTNAPSKGPKSPTSTTTYTITATGPGGTASASTTLTVYQPPVITLTLGSSSIISGGSTSLNWSVSGNTTSTTINQGIGSVTNNGSTTISPTVTTTYNATTTFTDPNGGTYSDSDSITLTVYQPPTLDITLPTDVNYGEDITLEYEYEYATISAKVTPQYRYRNANNDGFVNVTGDTVDLTPLSTSAEFGVPGTLVADKSVVLSSVYNDDGPFEINYTVEVKGDGGTETTTQNVKINIDLTPDNIAIPDTVGEKDEKPVYTPDPDEYPDTVLEVTDVDIPVEIKSNAPIKVSKDGGNTWSNVREKN